MKHLRTLCLVILGNISCVALVATRTDPCACPENLKGDQTEAIMGARSTTPERDVVSSRTIRPIAGRNHFSMSPVFFRENDKKTGPATSFKSNDDAARIDPSNSILGRILELNGYRPVKLDRAPAGYLLVTARIGDGAVSLVLDTGAPGTWLDRKQTQRLGIEWRDPPTDALRSIYSPTTVATGWYCYLPSIQVGTFRTEGLRVNNDDLTNFNRRLKDDGHPPVDGLLGADILERGQAIIDYRSNVLYLKAQD
jgi:Aspartyl protease